MTNKMVARVLTYELGLSSYGHSKLKKWKMKIKKMGFHSSSMFYGEQIFQMQQRMVPFSAGTNGE